MLGKLGRILSYARPDWLGFVLLGIATGATSLLAVLQPWPMKLLVDHVLGDVPVPAYVAEPFRFVGLDPTADMLLLIVVVGALLLFAAGSAIDAFTSWGWTATGQRVVNRLAEDLFARLQRRSLIYHGRTSVGETLMRITGDSWSAYRMIDSLLFTPLHALLTLGMMIALMLALDPELTAAALLIAPAVIAASFLGGASLRAAAEDKRQNEGQIRAHVQQTLAGIPVVQAFLQEDRAQARFHRIADALIRAQQRSTLVGGLNGLASGLVATLGGGAILWIGATHVLDGSLTIGGVLVFMAYFGALQGQVRTLARLYPALQGLAAGVERADEILRTIPEVAESRGAKPLPPVRGAVRFEEVSFGYEPGRPVLHGISFAVEAGETVALVGPTGAGKTTLAAMIPRLFDPWDGRVLIDGHDVRAATVRSVRALAAIVLQEPVLFPISVAENIAYGRPDASRQEVEEAARAANAHDFIRRLPDGYETVLAERGANLSGGERQRLSIARAILKDAPVLILDEPTSALDAGTEALIMEALQRLMGSRTSFVIAHRLATVRRADRVLVLDGGRIVESGRHGDLLARGGLYARLHRMQFGAPEAAE